MPDPVSLGEPSASDSQPSPPVYVAAEKGSSGSLVEARRLGKVPGLDGVRGLAAIIVVVCHFEIILPIPTFAVVPGGTVPLDMFFVLSGFLITSLLLREQAKNGRIGKWAFYERRILRLVPALFVLLAFHCLFAYLTGISFHEEWTSLMSVAFYYSNWKLALNSNAFGGNIANGLQHLWSLSFEEQFYLVWPWITIFILTIRQQLRTVIIVIVVMMAVIDIHMAWIYHGINSYYADFIRTDTRAGSILMGALLAHIWVRSREPTRYLTQTAWVAAAFLLFCMPFTNNIGPFLYRGGFVAIDICCAIVILAIVDGRWGGRHLFEFKPLVMLGLISYGVYLWHLPILFAIRYYGPHWNDAVKVVVALTSTLGVSIASWFLIERPFMRMKSRRAKVD
jgi:peptidoglycan/LPS O-acetylase OafA/YrhL